MRNIIGVHYGSKTAHPANEAWMRAVGVRIFVPFNFFTSQFMYKLGSLNQLFGLVYSLFIPKADTYFLTSTGCAITVILKKKLFGSKIVTINSDTFYRDLRNARGIRKLYMRWLAWHIDGMVSTSYMMKKLADPYIQSPHKMVYPYCDVKKFSKIKSKYQSADICSIGTGITTKGTDILFEVFAHYKKKFPKSKLYVCGSREWIKHLKAPKDVVLPGLVDPKSYLAKSGIYINTSRHESFGVNIVEAMCSGFAPLVTDRCGTAEIVQKIDPKLVTSLDPKEIAMKAVTLQKNIMRKKELGKKAKKLGIQFTKEKSIKGFKKAFDEIMRRTG